MREAAKGILMRKKATGLEIGMLSYYRGQFACGATRAVVQAKVMENLEEPLLAQAIAA